MSTATRSAANAQRSAGPSHARHFDVAICGGGLAGLALARQLRLQLPQLSVVVVDKLQSRIPTAAGKVGESTVEAGARYLEHTLGLAAHLRRSHLRKHGLRFFFPASTGRFQDRPEFGVSDFPDPATYQIDRGLLEEHLRQLNRREGAVLLEGLSVEDIALSGREDHHRVTYREPGTGRRQSVTCRWVVDALGRRRLLQKKLGLTKAVETKCSAAWFRVRGRLDVGSFVPQDEISWHRRVARDDRYYSTNHLMGDGYWVWLIPLSSDATSIGIVSREDVHPVSKFSTYHRAHRWLTEKEPSLAAHLRERDLLSFRCLRGYSHSSKQVFSIQRWACVGDAGLFPDPFYSPGIDLIGFSNTALVDMIGLDERGELSADTVKRHDRFVRSLNDLITHNTQLGYPFFGNAVVMAARAIWDFASAWSFLAPRMYSSTYLSSETEPQGRRAASRFFFLQRRMQRLFVDWACKSPGNASYGFIDYSRVPCLVELRRRNLCGQKPPRQLLEDQVSNMQTLAALARAIFLLALRDVWPELLPRVESHGELNPWGVSLEPDRWRADALFDSPRKASAEDLCIREQVTSLFRFHDSEMAEVAVGKR